MTLAGQRPQSQAASASVVLRTRALIALAVVAAVTACLLDALDGGASHVAARIAAAIFALAAGLAALLAFGDRARRDPTRRTTMRLLAGGFAVLWGGQAVGYLITAGASNAFDGRVEQIPLLLSMPFIAVAIVRTCWPSGMTDAERRTAILDSTVAVLAFGVVWWQFVVGMWQYPPESLHAVWWERLDQGVMFGLASVILVIAVVSRRIGSLPLPQLALLVGGLAVQVTADAVGQLRAQGDLVHGVTRSILGYSVAAGLVVAFARRPAVEVETARQRAIREFVALSVPLLAVLPAGAIVIAGATQAEAIDEWTGVLAVVTWATLLGAILVARVTAAYELRRTQDEGVAQVLAVRTREGWFRALVGDSAESVVVLDSDGRVLWASPRFERDADIPSGRALWPFGDVLVDTSQEELCLLLAQVSTDPSLAGPYDLVVRGRSELLELEAVLRPIIDVEFQGYVVTARDVSDTRRLARQLANSRRRDALTGLLSREAFLAETAEWLGTEEIEPQVAVVSLDLERFAALNDGLGHERGDQILVAVAAALDRLPASVRAASRLGSDTFALLVVDDEPERVLTEVVEQARLQLRGLLLPDGTEIEIGFHAGYVLSEPVEARSPEWHLEAADLALARSRSSRHARLVGYRGSMRDETERRLTAETRLRRALAEDRIEVYYQPVHRLSDGVVTGAEALARLREEDGRILPPADFIPLAEEIGLIREIGATVLGKAVRETARLSAESGQPLHIAVNIAVDQLTPDLVAQVDTVLAREGLPPTRLTLEITETTLADRSERTQRVLAELRARGVGVALDDFGTGYSSLSYLASLPVDGLKIDRSFVSVMGTSRQGLMLSRVVVQLASSLELRTIAEGVETTEQVDLLRGMGCDYAQGFYWARPLPLADYAAYVRGPLGVVAEAGI